MQKVQEEAETTLGMLAFDAFPRFLKSKYSKAVMEDLKTGSNPNEVQRSAHEFGGDLIFAAWRSCLGMPAHALVMMCKAVFEELKLHVQIVRILSKSARIYGRPVFSEPFRIPSLCFVGTRACS